MRKEGSEHGTAKIECWGIATGAKTTDVRRTCCSTWDRAADEEHPGPFLRKWIEEEYPDWLTERELDIVEQWKERDLKKLIKAARRLCEHESDQGPLLFRSRAYQKEMLLETRDDLLVAVFLHPEFETEP